MFVWEKVQLTLTAVRLYICIFMDPALSWMIIFIFSPSNYIAIKILQLEVKMNRSQCKILYDLELQHCCSVNIQVKCSVACKQIQIIQKNKY